MTEPVWLPLQTIIDLQSEQLARFGGPDGIRDSGLLESALARPVNRWHYGETDLAPLAASYAFGLARNHPFVDGNKRTAWVVARLFLHLNGARLIFAVQDAIVAVEGLAAGTLNEHALAAWFRGRLHP